MYFPWSGTFVFCEKIIFRRIMICLHKRAGKSFWLEYSVDANHDRGFAISSAPNGVDLWISGGIQTEMNVKYRLTFLSVSLTREIRIPRERKWGIDNVQLPIGLAGHCQVNIGSNIFIFGGVTLMKFYNLTKEYYEHSKQSWIYYSKIKSWVKVTITLIKSIKVNI